MSGPQEVMCELSGHWSELPTCTYMYYDTALLVIILLIVITFGIYLWWHFKPKSMALNVKPEKLPVVETLGIVSRNKEYDVILPSCSDMTDVERSIKEYTESLCNVSNYH